MWEGWVIDRMTHGSLPSMIISLLTRWFSQKVSGDLALRVQLPIHLNGSCPEPDVAIVRGKEADYQKRHPQPAEILLLIEVSDSTLNEDRDIKARMYARDGVPEYWIVNCEDRQVEVYTDPHAKAKTPHYRKLTTYLPGQNLPVQIAGKKLGELAVKELFQTKK